MASGRVPQNALEGQQIRHLHDELPVPKLFHEGFHQFVFHYAPATPIGLNEGLAEHYEQARPNRNGWRFPPQKPRFHHCVRLLDARQLTPLNRLHDQTMARQRRAIKQGEPTEALLDRQDAIAAEMEAILKAMTQWDSFIDVVNQLNEVIKLEQSVRDRTGELRGEITESIFDD